MRYPPIACLSSRQSRQPTHSQISWLTTWTRKAFLQPFSSALNRNISCRLKSGMMTRICPTLVDLVEMGENGLQDKCTTYFHPIFCMPQKVSGLESIICLYTVYSCHPQHGDQSHQQLGDIVICSKGDQGNHTGKLM